MRKTVAILMLTLTTSMAWAQETFPRNGVMDQRERAYAFTNATVYTRYNTKLENATLIIRDGVVEAVGTGLQVPAGYISIDLKGKYIYPGFIDSYTSYGMSEVKRTRGQGFVAAPETEGAYNANDAIKAHFNAADDFTIDAKEAKDFRKQGFGTVLSFRPDGLARGTSSIVTLGEETENKVMLKRAGAAHFSFDKGTSRQSYPGSPMGFAAVLRQTYLDAQWYSKLNPKPFTDITLDSWLSSQSLPQIFEASGWLTALRADKIGDEFGVQYVLVGGGDEYQRLSEIKASGAEFIIPLTFPDAYDVEDPLDAKDVSLADMKHWELAPTNPAALAKNNINFSLTLHGLKKKDDFWTNLRSAVKHGLAKEAALKALTYNPASMLRISDKVGALDKGYTANFLITSGDIFESGAKIHENWIQGKQYVVSKADDKDFSGNYRLSFSDKEYTMEVEGEAGKYKASVVINDSTKLKTKLSVSDNTVTLSFNLDKEKSSGDYRLSGWLDETKPGWAGKGQDPDGNWFDWTAVNAGKEAEADKKAEDETADIPEVGSVIYPFLAYGNETVPQQETILIKNATVWTNEAEGNLENTDVLLKGGKITKIGKDLKERGAREIDGTGKYLTPGIIDEHSHIAADRINDVAANSGMVRVGDVVNSENISIYRALAGGVTAIQILHGSANPIGGQSALIKLRWGAAPEQMKIAGADGFIKFALGENPKRFMGNARYPDTRMGVEQVFVDAFTSAQDYQAKWNSYNRLSTKAKAGAIAPRRDLAMETMSEIINGERFISCHSYVQSEINMLMKVAEQFNFKVNTFTHILEGYKVADKMAAHGVGGSTFSDWWAYKWEVRYAIPYNAAIMHNAGVVTAINSDDGEMMRRLNQEAAKSIKYGGMSEADAFKMVTLNPAKLLHLDDRMGSIKTGKDADVVLWSDNPLSVYAKVEKTIVDGTVYFDVEKDKAMREAIQKERARLIAKMRGAKMSGKPTQRPARRMELELHCDDIILNE
jgi:imidazolonepropionase-like amidohydrolase